MCRKKLIDDLIEQCTSIVDMEIKNGTDLVCSATTSFVNNTGNGSSLSSTNSGNVYLFLFIAVLIVAALLAAGFVYYCRKDNSKKLEDKIYDIAYSNTGTLNFSCAFTSFCKRYKMKIEKFVKPKDCEIKY